jgi:mannan endo-1,4-beta-mannosidase
MEPTQLDDLARTLSTADLAPSRRGLLSGLAGGIAGLAGLSLLDDADAKRKKKKRKKNKKKCSKKKRKKGKCGGRNGGGGGGPTPYTGPVFSVSGRNVLDTDGDPVILRGVNKMSVFDDDDPNGTGYFPQIALSGANTVRIVWAIKDDNGLTSVSQLDALITNCRNNKMLPMIELHDATGNLGMVPQLVDYWVRDDVREVIFKHSAHLLLNIANEAGDDTVTAQQWVNTYTTAIKRLRAASIRVPLVIDAPDFGKNLPLITPVANQLLAVDPNLIFSVHPYWPMNNGATPQFIEDTLEAARVAGFALVLGELSEWGAFNGAGSICQGNGKVDWLTLAQKASAKGFGMYAWEWGPGNIFGGADCDKMDMTTNGNFNTLKDGWAKDYWNLFLKNAPAIFG